MDDPIPHDLAFDPVPTARQRRDGWTPERQHAFILALASSAWSAPRRGAWG